MKIEIKQKYKSLNPFISEELNGLTVITGKNGSGKSQLLDLIGRLNYTDDNSSSQYINITPECNDVQIEGIVETETNELANISWKTKVNSYKEEYDKIPKICKQLRRFIQVNNIDLKKKGKLFELFAEEPYVKEYEELIIQAYDALKFTNQKQFPFQKEEVVISSIFSPQNERIFEFVKEICEFSGKSEAELIDNDFYNYPIQEKWLSVNDLFSAKIEMIFFIYANNRHLNEYQYFRKTVYNEDNNSLSDDDYVNKFPPPWTIINEILNKHKIDFSFNEIKSRDFSRESQFTIKILKKDSNDYIGFLDLSSGEKIIIGLILKLFTSRYYNEELKFPDLIVLDEPDAHLHPEMSKLLLDILEQTFVQKLGIKVIITTHSPSTVALAPEESLYELKNGIESSLKKISKDDALQLLTSFIPTLSIDYKNHRQVFVEGPNDILYYQGLYEKHYQVDKSAFKYKLYFISNANGQGNSTQVMNTVKAMQDANNKTCFGIVDWDKDNSDRGSNIFVHGFEKRYSVEQFVFDPIYIISLLMSNNNMQNILGEMGFQKTENPYFFKKSNDELQRIVDIFFEKFAKKYPKLKFDEKEEVEYLDGKRISLPIGFLKESGHDFVNKVFEFYPALKNKYKDQNGIQAELTNVMLRFYPFVPLSTIDLLKQIAN